MQGWRAALLMQQKPNYMVIWHGLSGKQLVTFDNTCRALASCLSITCALYMNHVTDEQLELLEHHCYIAVPLTLLN